MRESGIYIIMNDSPLGFSAPGPGSIRYAFESSSQAMVTIVYGEWPIKFLWGPVAFYWWLGLYVVCGITWASYAYNTRRSESPQRTNMTMLRLAWNFLSMCFSVVAAAKLGFALLDKWYLSSHTGLVAGMCTGVDTLLHDNSSAMLYLFLHVVIRPLKLYEIMFSESQGRTEPVYMLIFHLTSPLLVWMLAVFAYNTSVGAAWAFLLEFSHVFWYGYLFAKDLLRQAGLRPTPLMANCVWPTQLWYQWGGFLLAASFPTCDGKFMGNPRLIMLIVCAVYALLPLRVFHEKALVYLDTLVAPETTPAATPPGSPEVARHIAPTKKKAKKKGGARRRK